MSLRLKSLGGEESNQVEVESNQVGNQVEEKSNQVEDHNTGLRHSDTDSDTGVRHSDTDSDTRLRHSNTNLDTCYITTIRLQLFGNLAVITHLSWNRIKNDDISKSSIYLCPKIQKYWNIIRFPCDIASRINKLTGNDFIVFYTRTMDFTRTKTENRIPLITLKSRR